MSDDPPVTRRVSRANPIRVVVRESEEAIDYEAWLATYVQFLLAADAAMQAKAATGAPEAP